MYKRRVAILLIVMGVVFLALLGRLAALQIVNGQQCREEFEQSLIRVSFHSANRGQILDRTGRVLARDNVSYEFCMDYGLLSEDAAWARRQQRAIKKDLKVSDEQAKEVYQQRVAESIDWAVQACGSRERFDAIRQQIVARVTRIAELIDDRPAAANEAHVIAELENETQYRRFKDNTDGLLGVAVRHGRKRDYFSGQYACHIIGQVGPISREELDELNLTPEQEADYIKRSMHNYRPTDSIGKFGVEKLCENVLKPVRGYETMGGREQKEFVAAQNGHDVHLTIDMELQARLTDYFRATYPQHNGCMLVMDVDSGQILAMVSIPTYDLKTYWRRSGVSAATSQPLLADPPRNSAEWLARPYSQLVKDDLDFPLMNRCVTRLYPPGSTFKPLTAIAALTEGITDGNTSVECRGHMFEDAPDRWRCTGTHGHLSLTEAIRCSCNIYFYWAGEWLYRRNEDLLPQWMARLGMFDRPGTGLPEERRGMIGRIAEAERHGAARQMAIGQGPLAVTPLHVLNLMATIARGGELVRPTVVMPGQGGPDAQRIKLPVARAHMDLIREGMHKVTSLSGGTAYKVWEKQGGRELDLEVCGKSGTAQTSKQWKDQNGDGRMQDNEVIRDGNIVWFAGFAPKRRPQVAFVTLVEYVHYEKTSADPDEMTDEGPVGGGATVAGPLCIEALKACQELGYIKP